jgi:hypothetical protein
MLKVEETDTANDLNNVIDGRFAKPTYAIVNYDALVSLEIKANPNYIN